MFKVAHGVSLLNSNNQPKSYWHEMHQSVLAGKVWHDEVRNRAKNGHYYWVDTTIVPNYDNNRQVIGFTSIRTDITQQKMVLGNLAIAKKQAEAASVSKADFLANMSHEIRTPMNGVIGMTNLLLGSKLNNEQSKLANIVKSSAVGLLSIINDILDFSKVEAGKLELELIPFNLGNMLEDIGVTMSFQSQQKQLQLICPANPVIQQWVKADPGRIRQILTNLVGNAIKFTSKGEVTVYLHLIEQTEVQKVFRFEVKDTGIGIDKSHQNQLFEQFSQADNSTTRKYGGTGLGLSISKKLVEIMGGTIGIDSKIGQGSTFWFTLPLLTTKPTDHVVIVNTGIKKEKILIVDDSEVNRKLMHQLHSLWNIPHFVVESAKAALIELNRVALTEDHYTMAILDMNMPETDGLTLCSQIQANPTLAKIKLIIASSQAQRGDAQVMKEAGFKGYITKPIQQSELFDMLLMVAGLEDSDSDSELITRHTTLEYQQFKAHVLVVEDNITNQLVIEGMLRALGISVDLAANGEEAISALQTMHHYGLVFMDCQMPVLDGYEATKRIRSATTGIINSKIPIIAMTANAMAGDKEKCLDTGMDDYLSKPIDVKKVIEVLNKWLPDINSKAEVKDKNFSEQTSHETSIFDYDGMAKRMMNNTELMKSVADSFCQGFPLQITEIKACTKSKDITQATTIMHQIKGASANVGGNALSELALEMELASKAGHIDVFKTKIEQLEHHFKSLKAEMDKAF